MIKKIFYKLLNYFSERKLKKERALKRAKMLEDLKKRDPFVYPQF